MPPAAVGGLLRRVRQARRTRAVRAEGGGVMWFWLIVGLMFGFVLGGYFGVFIEAVWPGR